MAKNTRGNAHVRFNEDTQPAKQGARFVQGETAPKLTTIDRKSILKFFDDRKDYLTLLDEHNTNYHDNQQAKRLTQMVERMLRCNLIQRYPTELGNDPDMIDDEHLQTLLQGLVNKAKGQDTSSIEEDLEGIRLDYHIGDVGARLMDLLRQFTERERECGLLQIFQENPKAKIDAMIKCLRPGSLKNVVSDEVKIKQPELKKNLSKFLEFLEETMLSQNRWHKKERNNSTPSSTGGASSKGGTSNYHGKEVGSAFTSSSSGPKSHSSSNKQSKRKWESKTESGNKKAIPDGKPKFQKGQCFNCSGSHKLAECPKMTPNEKDTMMDKVRAERFKGGRARAHNEN
jgi:hypothetical protein